MIPLRDDVASHRITLANALLIIVNVAVFAWEESLGPHAEAAIDQLALVPAALAIHHPALGGAELWPPLTLITSLFVHGGILHVAGNMLYLFIFGAAVEEAMGHVRYMLFYLICGIASALAMAAFTPHSTVPVIGASGAIAGVLGAYFILYPRGRILTFFPPFFFRVPAVLYLIVWFAAQLYSGIAGGAAGSLMGGVAWWAHVGGFLFGVAAGPIAVRTPERRRVARR